MGRASVALGAPDGSAGIMDGSVIGIHRFDTESSRSSSIGVDRVGQVLPQPEASEPTPKQQDTRAAEKEVVRDHLWFQLSLDETQTDLVSARRPPRIINSLAGPSLLAGLAVGHFADHQPYYRLEEILGRSGLVIDRGTQCRWMIRLAQTLAPLTDWMRSLALQSPVVQADETPVKMLVPGQGQTSTTYLWAVLGDRRHPYTTFSFTESRARAGPAEFFADFRGILVSDAYIGYEFLPPHTQGRIRLAGCYAHARRKFEQLHVLGPTEQTATAMGYFQRLFDMEDELRNVSDEARHHERQLRARPLLEEFKRWLDDQLETLRPKHDLRGAAYSVFQEKC